MDTCHYAFHKHRECATLRVKPKENYELWVITMCHYRFILDKKYVILVSDVDNGGDGPCMGAGSIWETSASSSQLCCKPKTALKK